METGYQPEPGATWGPGAQPFLSKRGATALGAGTGPGWCPQHLYTWHLVTWAPGPPSRAPSSGPAQPRWSQVQGQTRRGDEGGEKEDGREATVKASTRPRGPPPGAQGLRRAGPRRCNQPGWADAPSGGAWPLHSPMAVRTQCVGSDSPGLCPQSCGLG